MSRRVAARTSLLAGALALALTATLLGCWQPARAAATTTTLSLSGPATVGVPVDLVAAVSPADVPGEVFFDVAGEPVGTAAVVGGVAVLSHTFQQAGTVSVGAVFEPTNPVDTGSQDARDVVVTLGPSFPSPTSTTVTGPASAAVAVPVPLTADVAPAVAAGTVQFSVDGTPVGDPASVSGGAAQVMHTFVSGGAHVVTASFAPSQPELYASSADVNGLGVSVAGAVTTTEVSAPAGARVGSPVPITATVSPSSAQGTVAFTVDGVPVGGAVPVAGGTATTEHTFSSVGASTVRASFLPTDEASYSASADDAGATVTVGPMTTTVSLTAPDRVVAGAEAILTATVAPADVAGVVRFLVNGRKIRTVPVVDGTAKITHRFLTLGNVAVSAVWVPADAGSYESSVSLAQTTRVAAGTTAAELGTFLSAEFSSLSFSLSCTNQEGRAVPRVDNPVYNVLFSVFAFYFEVLRQFFSVITLTFKAVLCSPGARGGQPATVRGTVACLLTDTGLACPLDLPPVSRIQLSGSLPVPATLAGQDLELGTSLSTVDPLTGELTEVDTGQGVVRVPRRTVLSGSLGPVAADRTSVGREKSIAYRVRVRNTGVVTADRVETCVQVDPGAEIRRARGATVRGRRACWTLPRLAKGAGVTRTVTVGAPQRPGELRVRAVVTPRRTQADVLRLATVLQVR